MRELDIDQAFELMWENPFATVITSFEEKPYISQLPIVPRRESGQVELIGHMARANPHWQFLDKNMATVLFHGPHAYITPKWYERGGVPTWNYSSVHATGGVSLIEDEDGVVECLAELSRHSETLWPSGWAFTIPENMGGAFLSRAIVAFRIEVEVLDFKQKLSGGKSEADVKGVLQGLETRTDENSRRLAKDMQRYFAVHKSSSNGDSM